MADTVQGPNITIGIEERETDEDTQPETAMQVHAQFMANRYVMFAQGVQSLSTAYFMMQMQEERQLMMQDMLENSQTRILIAQDNYNRAVQMYGAKSSEALLAQRNLNMAHDHLTREHMIANMMMEREWMTVLPEAMAIMSGLMSITIALAEAQAQERGGAKEAAMEAVYLSVAMGMGFAVGATVSKVKHGGGIVGDTGMFYLEKGEVVSANKQQEGAGGKTFHITVTGYPGMDSMKVMRDLGQIQAEEDRQGPRTIYTQ